MTLRRLTVVAATLAAAALSACGGDGERTTATTAADATTVDTKTFIFNPDPLTVKAGATVTFENSDGTVHTVVGGTREKADKALIDGRMEPSSGTYEVTFDSPGTYPYFCDIHSGEGMTGEIVVQ